MKVSFLIALIPFLIALISMRKNLMAHESKGSSTGDLSLVWMWQENGKAAGGLSFGWIPKNQRIRKAQSF